MVRANHKRSAATGSEKVHIDVRYQVAIRNFEIAARAFQRQNYAKAKEVFEKLASGEVSEVAERARVHLRLCEQRLGRSTPGPKTSEDYYTLGVGELNARRLDAAVEHLTKAQKLNGSRDHIRYALAAAHALRGNAEVALEHLQAAIQLRSENRIQARHDEDFQGLAHDPRFRSLVFSSAASEGRLNARHPA
jgi:tetratricopeptide (TPR) repeat protein